MAAHTKFFIGLTATALLVVIGAGFYEMDRRGRSQFDDLAARVEEVDSSLSQLRRDFAQRRLPARRFALMCVET